MATTADAAAVAPAAAAAARAPHSRPPAATATAEKGYVNASPQQVEAVARDPAVVAALTPRELEHLRAGARTTKTGNFWSTSVGEREEAAV